MGGDRTSPASGSTASGLLGCASHAKLLLAASALLGSPAWTFALSSEAPAATEDALVPSASGLSPTLSRREPRPFRLGGDWKLLFGPGDFLYPRYLADPRRPTLSFASLETSDSQVAGAGNSRYGVRIGQRVGVARFYRGDDPTRGFQLDAEVGFNGQFDVDNSTDNLGWDGFYGLHLSWLGIEDVALRVGLFHDSSHLGDEYIESTGRTRIDYTREELLFGASWAFADRWNAYGEYGHGFGLRNEALMEAGRAQCGLEYQSPPVFWNERMGWYSAVDLSFYEEDRWSTNVTAQAGVSFGSGGTGSLLRLGLEYYDGRSQIGELFQSQESYLAWGLWLDL